MDWMPKSSNVADSATSLILACCGSQLQCIECTVWPRNEGQNKDKIKNNKNLNAID